MARDRDTQVLDSAPESAALRHRRLRDAAFPGRGRAGRTLDESINKILIGLCVSALVCAGCVGWSVVRTHLLNRQEQAQSPQAAPRTDAVQVPTDWATAQVTVPMLRDALAGARVPSSLYVLPGGRRPSQARTSSYYLLAEKDGRFSAGIVEGRQSRVGAEFVTEDEACRWMYGELVVRETRPKRLTSREEQQVPQLTAALDRDVRIKIAQGAGDSFSYPLPQGSLVDQFGQESGSMLSPTGTSFARRGLPPSARLTVNPRVPSAYHRYRVVRSFRVDASIVPAGSGGQGGAVRFTISAGLLPQRPALPSVRWLVRNGYLERIMVAAVPG